MSAPGAPEPVAPVTPGDLEVDGGVGGLQAQYVAVERLAMAYDAAAALLAGRSRDVGLTLLDDDLLCSAPYAPRSFASVEAQLAALAAGPGGLLATAARWTLQADSVRTSSLAFRTADELVTSFVDHLQHRLGYLVAHPTGVGLRLTGNGDLLPEPGGDLGPLLDRLSASDGGDGGGAARLEAWALENPDHFEVLVGTGGGVLEGLWDSDGLPSAGHGRWALPTIAAAAGALALWFTPGRPVVVPAAPADAPVVGRRAGGLAGLVEELERVAGASGPGRDGTIEVQRTGSGADASYVVLLPGTDDLVTSPDEHSTVARDLGTNLASMAGRPTVYTEGILEAMRDAGIPPDAPVTIVGHSQGGMAGVQIAASGEFAVEHVVTLGSPVALMPEVPPGVEVTSLENESDLVARLDGQPNPDRLSHVTVRFDAGGGSLAEAHALERYAAGAAAVDASGDPTLRQRLESLGPGSEGGSDGGPGEEVARRAYRITRG
ncbi:lipase family protein [Nocardioides zeae]|uniref:Lipase family protein n=1 Tax=Nocardioides imazamoxiresistens TaxID=3231893 RepID=A0ABU3PW39_9ACTN|nr:lipase family protein [Nocardioides zeae]MDT9593438.1 lipase family protein [Nocardioides zeae]